NKELVFQNEEKEKRVTELASANAKYELGELKFKQAQTMAHVGSWELNFATGIALWSDEACRIRGLSPEENRQSQESFLSFVHPDDLSFVTKMLNDSNTSLVGSSFYYRIVRRDGVVRYIYTKNRFEFDANGKPKGLYGISHDITEIKLAEQNLENSEKRFREFFESSPV